MWLFKKKNTKDILPKELDYSLINELSNTMKEILDNELKCGNKIKEIYKGRFTNIPDDSIFIFLEYPFKAEIKHDLENVVYRNINDRHYWKAEYNDTVNNQTIVCPFEK